MVFARWYKYCLFGSMVMFFKQPSFREFIEQMKNKCFDYWWNKINEKTFCVVFDVIDSVQKI